MSETSRACAPWSSAAGRARDAAASCGDRRCHLL